MSSCFAKPCSKTQLFVGLLQFYTAVFLIGWIMSIYWGVLIVTTALRKGEDSDEQNTSATGPSSSNYNSQNI